MDMTSERFAEHGRAGVAKGVPRVLPGGAASEGCDDDTKAARVGGVATGGEAVAGAGRSEGRCMDGAWAWGRRGGGDAGRDEGGDSGGSGEGGDGMRRTEGGGGIIVC